MNTGAYYKYELHCYPRLVLRWFPHSKNWSIFMSCMYWMISVTSILIVAATLIGEITCQWQQECSSSIWTSEADYCCMHHSFNSRYCKVLYHVVRVCVGWLQMLVRFVEQWRRCDGLQMALLWPCAGSTVDSPSGVSLVHCFITQWLSMPGMLLSHL